MQFPMDVPLELEVQMIREARGSIRVGIFNEPEQFPESAAAFRGYVHPVQELGTMRINLPALPVGEYAVAIYHDLNDNGKLDKNIVGVPTEPYAFSVTPGNRWRVPRFAEAKFLLTGKAHRISVSLKYWHEL